MGYFEASLVGILLFGASAFAGGTATIFKTDMTPLCFVLAHEAAPGSLQRAIAAAEDESKIQCGIDSAFFSESVSMETIQIGCGALKVEVKGKCFKP